jgi:hypothetical protein
MTYKDWANEYQQQADYLKDKLTQLKEERRVCRRADLLDNLTKRINSLYSMYLEAMHTAQLLNERAMEGLIL